MQELLGANFNYNVKFDFIYKQNYNYNFKFGFIYKKITSLQNCQSNETYNLT